MYDLTKVNLTIYWLSQESEPSTFSWNPLLGWYRLKKRLMEYVPHLQLQNALRISLFRLQEDDLVECRSGEIISGVYYASVNPHIIHERLDYIYPIEGTNLWRWTYRTQEGAVASISFIECNGQFCRLQEFHQAKQTREPIPWHPSIDKFMTWISEHNTLPEENVRMNLLLLWHQRRW